MKGKRYFKCEPNKGMFILAKEIQRKLSPEELIQKIIHLSEALSRARQQRSHNVSSGRSKTISLILSKKLTSAYPTILNLFKLGT